MSSKDWIDIAIGAMPIIEDQKIDAKEAEQLIRKAEKDGVVDEDEKRVLAKIFMSVDMTTMKEEVVEKIREFRASHNF